MKRKSLFGAAYFLLSFICVALSPATQTNLGITHGYIRGGNGATISGATVELTEVSRISEAGRQLLLGVPRAIQLGPALVEELVARERLSAGRPAAGISMVTQSNELGYFEFERVPPGAYLVRAAKEGYVSSGPVTGTAQRYALSSLLEVGEGTSVSINLDFQQLGSISGQISDPNGFPAANVRIEPMIVATRDGITVLRTLTEIPPRTTDDLGDYRLFGLPPGDYLLRATPTTGGWARTFFPGVTSATDAVPVTLSSGRDMGGVRFGLRSAHRITGSIATLNIGEQRRWYYLLVPVATNLLVESEVAQLLVVADGLFEIQGVPNGTYILVVSGSTVIGKTRVTVNGDISDVSVAVAEKSRVRATFLWNGQRNNEQLTAELKSSALPVAWYEIQGQPDEASRDSVNFDDVPPDTYYLTVSNLPENAYIADIRDKGISAYTDGLVVAGGGVHSVDVQIDYSDDTLEGILVDSQQSRIWGEHVVLVPASVSLRRNPMGFKSALTDSRGRFVFRGVRPGSYKLFGWAHSPSAGSWSNAEFLAAYETRGQFVEIVAGQTARDLIVTAINN